MTSFVSHRAQQQGLIPSDEPVRWSGAPRAGFFVKRSDYGPLAMALAVCGFLVFWETLAVQSGVVFMMLWGAFIGALMLYQFLGPFFRQAKTRARTRYVVTDRAAYAVIDGPGGGVRRFAGSLLDDVRVERNDDGSGTLRFGPDTAPAWGQSGGVVPWPRSTVNGFDSVRDLDGAYAAVLAAQQWHGE